MLNYSRLGAPENDTAPETIACLDAAGIRRDQPLTREFLDEIGVSTWTNTLWTLPSMPMHLTKSEQAQLTALIQKSQNVEKKLAITPISGALREPRYEAVAIDLIPQNSYLIYSGVRFPWLEENDIHAYGSEAEGFRVSAKEYSNMAKFFSHAFDEKTLESEVGFYGKASKEQIATANFEQTSFKTKSGNFLVLRSIRDILPGEKALWSFGIKYFDALNISPVLFDKSTHISIDPEQYYWKNFYLKFSDTNASTPSCYNIIHGDGYCRLEATYIEKSYDIFMHANFFIELEEKNKLSQSYCTQMNLPMTYHPFIKRLDSKKNLNEELMKILSSILGDAFSLISWDEAVLSPPVASSSQKFFRAGLKVYHTQSSLILINAMTKKLEAVKLERNSDFWVSSSGAELYILQSALFTLMPSSIEYYKEFAESIYAFSSEKKWSGVEKNGTPIVWLALPDNAEENLQLLNALAKHINSFLLKLDIYDKVKIELRGKEKNIPTLMINDARIFSLINIPRFTPSVIAAPISKSNSSLFGNASGALQAVKKIKNGL